MNLDHLSDSDLRRAITQTHEAILRASELLASLSDQAVAKGSAAELMTEPTMRFCKKFERELEEFRVEIEKRLSKDDVTQG